MCSLDDTLTRIIKRWCTAHKRYAHKKHSPDAYPTRPTATTLHNHNTNIALGSVLYNTLFSREEIFAKSEFEIFSRENIFANLLFTRKYLPAKIENTSVQFRHKNGKRGKVKRAKLASRQTETRRTGTASKWNAPNWHASNWRAPKRNAPNWHVIGEGRQSLTIMLKQEWARACKFVGPHPAGKIS